MTGSQTSAHYAIARQITHWTQAANKLSFLDDLASGNAWQGIDHRVGMLLKQSLQKSVDDVINYSNYLKRLLETNNNDFQQSKLKNGVLELKTRYLRSEETIQFYTDAINSRTTPKVAALLRACDILCKRSMSELLLPLNKETPEVLTYIQKGAGASILKSGLRLWDGTVSPVAAIKVTHHNLFRPTSIIHETGHQIAHILHWNEELANAFSSQLNQHPKIVSTAFAGWASEIAADAFAFVHTGFAAVAALHDVISGTPESVLTYHIHDPHPIGYIRVLMNVEMCRQFFGSGPWDHLSENFKTDHDLRQLTPGRTEIIQLCYKAIPDLVKIVLKSSFKAFGNRPLSELIPPDRVSPQNLEKLEKAAGPSLYTSHAWIWKECLRILAVNGYKIGTGKGNLPELYKQQEEWMQKLGFSIPLN